MNSSPEPAEGTSLEASPSETFDLQGSTAITVLFKQSMCSHLSQQLRNATRKIKWNRNRRHEEVKRLAQGLTADCG